MPNVFISYAREDKPFANRLADELKKRDFSVWIDTRSIQPGADWLSEIEKGLEKSDYFLLVLTPAAMLSNWVTEEREAAYRRAVDRNLTFVPLQVIRGDYDSLLLESRQWVDFSQSFNSGLRKLLESMGLTNIDIPRRDEFFLPYRRNPYFIGHTDALQEIQRIFDTGKPAGIIGIPGIGKTQIAVKYAYTNQYSYPDGVYWINASSSLEEGLLEIAEELGWEPICASTSETAHNVWIDLCRQSNALVIVDNLRDASELAYYLQSQLQLGKYHSECKILFTARNGLKDEWYTTCRYIELSSREAEEILLSRSSADHDIESANKICSKFDNYPLPISIVAAYISTVKDADLDQYLEQIEGFEGQSTLFEDFPKNLSRALSAILHVQWQQIDENEQDILKTVSLFRESRHIHLAWLELLSNEEWDPDRIEHIFRLGLFEDLHNDQVCLHPLIHQFVSSLTPQAELESFRLEIENNLIKKIANNSGDLQVALTAGDLLIKLDWQPINMRGPIVDALWLILKDDAISEPNRREVGFKLLKLRWPHDQELVSGEELFSYLETINPYVGNIEDIQFLLSRISHALDILSLDNRMLAHLNVHRAFLHYQLSVIHAGFSKSDHLNAQNFLDSLNDTPKGFLTEDYKLKARIFLGIGNIIREHDRDSEQALEFHQNALDAAKHYAEDILLLINASKELSRTLSLCEMWDEADEVLLNTYENKIFKNMEISDPGTYAIYSSNLSENATLVHWDKGKKYSLRFARNKEMKRYEANAIRSYLLAYDYANKAIATLKKNKLVETINMIYAHFNAAECLKSLDNYKNHREVQQRIDDPISLAKIHWQEIIRIANILGVKDFEQEAKKSLETFST